MRISRHVCGIITLAVTVWACGKTTGVRSLPGLPVGTRVLATEEPYEVRGNSVETIRISMRNAAAQELGGRYRGYHRWDVRWRYRYREEPTGCLVTEVTMDLQSTITLPRWVERETADSALVEQWDSYIVALRNHEYCHRVLAYQQANEIHRRVMRVRSPSCTLLTAEVDGVGREIMEKYRELNKDYDEDSRGYITWPPTMDEKEPPTCPIGR